MLYQWKMRFAPRSFLVGTAAALPATSANHNRFGWIPSVRECGGFRTAPAAHGWPERGSTQTKQ